METKKTSQLLVLLLITAIATIMCACSNEIENKVETRTEPPTGIREGDFMKSGDTIVKVVKLGDAFACVDENGDIDSSPTSQLSDIKLSLEVVFWVLAQDARFTEYELYFGFENWDKTSQGLKFILEKELNTIMIADGSTLIYPVIKNVRELQHAFQDLHLSNSLFVSFEALNNAFNTTE